MSALGDTLRRLATPPLELPPARRRAARFVALGADALQLVLFPLFGEGFASPLDDALDLAVGALLVRLVGFHWAFLPAAALELTPGLDLAPTWTAAVLLATGAGRPVLRWLAVALGLLGLGFAAWWSLHR